MQSQMFIIAYFSSEFHVKFFMTSKSWQIDDTSCEEKETHCSQSETVTHLVKKTVSHSVNETVSHLVKKTISHLVINNDNYYNL